jgi:hypothetical protein
MEFRIKMETKRQYFILDEHNKSLQHMKHCCIEGKYQKHVVLLNIDATNNHHCFLNQVNLKRLIRSVLRYDKKTKYLIKIT